MQRSAKAAMIFNSIVVHLNDMEGACITINNSKTACVWNQSKATAYIHHVAQLKVPAVPKLNLSISPKEFF